MNGPDTPRQGEVIELESKAKVQKHLRKPSAARMALENEVGTDRKFIPLALETETDSKDLGTVNMEEFKDEPLNDS